MQPGTIKIDEYDYALPPDRIAQHPLSVRDTSTLLVYKNGKISKDTFRHLADHIPAGSCLVFNDTKVIHARLFFEYKQHVLEVFCLEPIAPEILPEKALEVKHTCTWACMIGNARKWKEGILKKEVSIDNQIYTLTATRGAADDNAYHITFEWNGQGADTLTFGDIIEHAGAMPLPPYIKRSTDNEDESRYQTIYAEHKGSVAAPTAGLHFTTDVLNSLEQKGIQQARVTLHVGAGTFKPVKAGDIAQHVMHEEILTAGIETLYILKEKINTCIAVGTTSLRTIESVYWCGVRLILKEENPFYIPQWYAYEALPEISFKESMEALISYMEGQKLDTLTARTQLLCMPGYAFHGIMGLITNFHQPRSTLLLLVSAFIGDDWKKVYSYAMDNNFRFLSYGDASLLFRNDMGTGQNLIV